MPRRIVEKVNKHAGAAILLLGLIGTGSYAYTLNQFSAQNECQSKVNLAVSQNIRVRSEIAERDTAAKTLLLSAVGDLFLLPPTEDEKEQERRNEKFLDLFRDFKVTMLEVETARTENPVPEIEGICD